MMYKTIQSGILSAIITVALFSCGEDNPEPPAQDAVISIAAIGGITAPAAGATPVTAITATDQFTGTVAWQPAHDAFAYATAYTAAITLTPKTGYTLAGVGANFFTVAGATSAGNAAGSGVITAVFPKTADPADVQVSIKEIEGLTAPVAGATPVTEITETEQFTGTVTEWLPAVESVFAYGTEYIVKVNLTAKQGFTFDDLPANHFTVEGATNIYFNATNGELIVVFQKTADEVTPPTVTGALVKENVWDRLSHRIVPAAGNGPGTCIEINGLGSAKVTLLYSDGSQKEVFCQDIESDMITTFVGIGGNYTAGVAYITGAVPSSPVGKEIVGSIEDSEYRLVERYYFGDHKDFYLEYLTVIEKCMIEVDGFVVWVPSWGLTGSELAMTALEKVAAGKQDGNNLWKVYPEMTLYNPTGTPLKFPQFELTVAEAEESEPGDITKFEVTKITGQPVVDWNPVMTWDPGSYVTLTWTGASIEGKAFSQDGSSEDMTLNNQSFSIVVKFESRWATVQTPRLLIYTRIANNTLVPFVIDKDKSTPTLTVGYFGFAKNKETDKDELLLNYTITNPLVSISGQQIPLIGTLENTYVRKNGVTSVSYEGKVYDVYNVVHDIEFKLGNFKQEFPVHYTQVAEPEP